MPQRKEAVLVIDDLEEGVLKPYAQVMREEFRDHHVITATSIEDARKALQDSRYRVDYMVVDGGFFEGGQRTSGTGQKLIKEVLGDPQRGIRPQFEESDPELHKRVIIVENTATPKGSKSKGQEPMHKVNQFHGLLGADYQSAFGYTPHRAAYFQKAPQPFDREHAPESNEQVRGEFEKWHKENDAAQVIQWTPDNQLALTQHVARQMAQFMKQERRLSQHEAPLPELSVAPRGLKLELGDNPSIEAMLESSFMITVAGKNVQREI
ncbi:MAG: hypothetical protein J0M34_04930 [Alphaproteobacteria bacterium]|nr:hypothetical protein [Alphaproteobacteria bacterium]